VSASANTQPSRPASSAPTVVFPLPATPATMTITPRSLRDADCLPRSSVQRSELASEHLARYLRGRRGRRPAFAAPGCGHPQRPVATVCSHVMILTRSIDQVFYEKGLGAFSACQLIMLVYFLA
jgi:hypothetical protein